MEIQTNGLKNVRAAREKDGFRELPPDGLHAELRQLYRDHRERGEGRAEGIAFDHPGEGRDLLHVSVSRALTSRSYREDLTAEQFLGGIMRSIASTARRSRERRQEDPVVLPVDEATERMGLGGYVVKTADEIIETERVRQLCIDVIDRLAAASEQQAALLDGIGLDLRGQALANHVGITLDELASIRRALKRQVQRLSPVFSQSLSSDAS